jgi:MFS family permease
MNFVSGRLSERVGRRRVLIWGWLVALPIPFVFLLAPSWNWIIAANVLLGVNQGFAWSMTVTSKLDIVRADERGLATGFNEFAGYGGVALAGVITGYLAADFDPRWSLFVFGLAVVPIATERMPGRGRTFRKTSPSGRPAARFSGSSRTGTQPSWPCRRPVVSRNSSTCSCGGSFRYTCLARA